MVQYYEYWLSGNPGIQLKKADLRDLEQKWSSLINEQDFNQPRYSFLKRNGIALSDHGDFYSVSHWETRKKPESSSYAFFLD
jgi:hypothetical protein